MLSKLTHHHKNKAITSALKYIKVLYFTLFSAALFLFTKLLGLPLVSCFLILAFAFYLSSSKDILLKNKKQAYGILTFLFLTFLFITQKITEHNIHPAYIPVTGLILIIGILFTNLNVSFAFCALSALLAGILTGNSLLVSLIFFTTAILTAFLVQKVRTRIQILTAGLYAGLIQMFLYWLSFPGNNFFSLLPHLYSGLLSSIVVTGILPVLENMFGIVTNISLLELSDFNHPLLKKMILEAPGTYHHSLLVGNLAEAASESISANSMLARIGAYYHDIGKLSTPEYFMENQKNSSKHSSLNPSMSKMVIMNHVKEGVELAKKYKLKNALIDFINQHHGTSLVYYFYRKALEETQSYEEIQEEGFRYPGPRPTTKETAIVLLADSVEAACRVIDDPQQAKIEEVVHKVINNKFIDRQLDDCELTLKDLETIAKTFIHMLSGIYHGRIKYPEGSRREPHHRKPDLPIPPLKPRHDKEHH